MIGARTSRRRARKGVASLLLLTVLGACDGGRKGPEPAANEGGNATTAIVLPPSIRKTSSYRCKDKSIVSVDFLDDDRTINLRDESSIVQLSTVKVGWPYTGKGISVEVKNSGIVIEQAGREPRQCK